MQYLFNLFLSHLLYVYFFIIFYLLQNILFVFLSYEPDSSSLLRDLEATILLGDLGQLFLDAKDKVSWLKCMMINQLNYLPHVILSYTYRFPS